MFVIGHLAAPVLVRGTASRWSRLAGVVLLLGGIFLCSGQHFDPVGKLFLHLHSPVGPATDVFHFKAMLAEIFVFTGVAMLPGLQRLLALPVARRAGKLSFSLYLIHFPVLFTLVSALFLRLHTIMAYGAAVALCTLIGGAVSVSLAVLFEAWVDSPAILLSRAITAPRKPSERRIWRLPADRRSLVRRINLLKLYPGSRPMPPRCLDHPIQPQPPTRVSRMRSPRHDGLAARSWSTPQSSRPAAPNGRLPKPKAAALRRQLRQVWKVVPIMVERQFHPTQESLS
jgi:hypothetical protein